MPDHRTGDARTPRLPRGPNKAPTGKRVTFYLYPRHIRKLADLVAGGWAKNKSEVIQKLLEEKE